MSDLYILLKLIITNNYYFFLRSLNDNYFYWHRISYLYCIVLGFMVTFLVALVVSSIFNEPHCNNPDLFTPFVARRLRKRGLLLKKDFVKMVCFFKLPIYF